LTNSATQDKTTCTGEHCPGGSPRGVPDSDGAVTAAGEEERVVRRLLGRLHARDVVAMAREREERGERRRGRLGHMPHMHLQGGDGEKENERQR
jgi:hypothetical protein